VSSAWPPPPDWMQLDVAPRRLRRGEAVEISFNAQPDLETDVGMLHWDLVISVDRPLRPDLVERVTLVVERS
jgi:hypothetical protein